MKGDFGRVGLGSVLFDPECDHVLWLLNLAVSGLEDGDQIISNYSVPRGAPLPVAHNALIRLFLKTDLDSLCFVEDDNDGPADAIRRLRFKPANQQFDIVCASYVSRHVHRPWPIGFNLLGQDPDAGYLVQCNPFWVKKEGTQAMDGGGLGCTLIRRWVLEAMAEGHDRRNFEWMRWVGHSSLDIDFFVRAKAIGATCGIDRDLWISHWGKYKWERSDWEDYIRKNRWAWWRQTPRRLLKKWTGK